MFVMMNVSHKPAVVICHKPQITLSQDSDH